MGTGKRIQEDWKVVLGESALDIRPGCVSSAVDGSGGRALYHHALHAAARQQLHSA